MSQLNVTLQNRPPVWWREFLFLAALSSVDAHAAMRVVVEFWEWRIDDGPWQRIFQ